MCGSMVTVGFLDALIIESIGKWAPGSVAMKKQASTSFRTRRSTEVVSPVWCRALFLRERSTAYGNPYCQPSTCPEPVTFQCPRIAMIANFVKSFKSRVRLMAISILWFLPIVWVRPMPKKMTPKRALFKSSTTS